MSFGVISQGVSAAAFEMSSYLVDHCFTVTVTGTLGIFDQVFCSILGKKTKQRTIKDWTFNHLLLSLLSVMKTTLFYFIHQCKLCNCSGLHSGEFRWLTGSRLFSVAVEMILQDPGSVKSTRRRIHTKAKNTSENILDKVPKDWASSDRLPDGLSLRWERWSSTLVWGRHQVCRQEPVTRQERKNVRKEDKRKEREEKRREQVRKKEQTNK